MVIPIVTHAIIICLIVYAANSINPIPSGWKRMCTATFDSDILALYVENVTGSSHVIHIQCHVNGNKGETLQFETLRNQLGQIRDTSLFLQIRCSNRGNISLPWPMKAQGLIGLVVSNCIMTDKYADFGNPDISNIPEYLKVLEITDSAWLSDEPSFDRMTSPEGLASLTSDYDCGQDSTIEYLVNSNVTYLLTSPADGVTASSDLTSGTSTNQASNQDLDNRLTIPDQTLNTTSDNKSIDDRFLNLLQNLQALDVQCNFEQLKLLDESDPHVLPIQHFELMVQGAKYPELRIMNYSFSGIRNFPKELQDFKTYFPKLEYLDLSWNYLTEIKLPVRPRQAAGSYLTLDVRHNLISKISVENITAWSMVEGVIVDIRDNPIHCGCEMQRTLQKIQSDTFFVGNLEKYSYLRSMKCVSPSVVRGNTLSEVKLRCAGDNYVFDSTPRHTPSTDSTVGVAAGCIVAAVIVVSAALLAAVVINLRLGKDIFTKRVTDTPKPAPETDTEAGIVNLKTKDVF